MENAKEKLIKYIEQLPDNISEDEIAYHIYVREEIRKAKEQVDEGKTISHENIKEKYKQWL